MQKHEIVIKKLVSDIFNHKLKDGDKLPTERQMAMDLGVDRTSLRVALKQLEAMQVLDIRQGDGIYVRDYRRSAGIDFLRMLLDQEGKSEEPALVEYLFEEIWTFWIEFMPLMIRMAMPHIRPMDLKALIDIYDQELENIDDPEKIIELEVFSQEMVAEKTGNLLIQLISNSTRQMRVKLVRRFVQALSREKIRSHVEFKRALLRGYTTGAFSDASRIPEEHKKLLKMHWEVVRGTWKISDAEQEIVRRMLADGVEKKAAS